MMGVWGLMAGPVESNLPGTSCLRFRGLCTTLEGVSRILLAGSTKMAWGHSSSSGSSSVVVWFGYLLHFTG